VAKLNLAFAYLRGGQFKDAEAQLEAVLEQDPTQSAAAAKLAELRTGRAAEGRRATPRSGPR
jgi:Tfp pilus assembly protein PilF